eukprot:Blabericola_migrator_1__2122@NODE_1586_length_4224_cov_94_207602_g1036_i0_p1_GENE_NODE_1586_length_4224_cov_94_207602_g1036_i0NODE_1586_length_4224_cov_94_207602_g1036_i0_p1_ORF_typecomplete_len716_score128_11PARP/PF00644_20/7_9e38PARP_reg/PF02877_14/1_4e24WGR/PF05406_15/0_082WGR/PF05406_15/1e06_NODE_1586_length_4224_cov_94_207602_g1036_i09123059
MGAMILAEDWLLDLLGIDDENRDPVASDKAHLRLAKRMQPYKLSTGALKDIPVVERTVHSRSIPVRPRIVRDSALMKLDVWFPRKEDWIEDIYVDRRNHAFSAMTSFCDIETGRNSFYLIQLVERYQLVKDTGQKKRKMIAKATTKGRKKGTAVIDDDLSSSCEFEEKANLSLFKGPYIDLASLSEAEYEEYLECKKSYYYVFRKWGRLGSDNKTTNDALTEEFQTDLEGAKSAFCTKFMELTGISFYHRFEEKSKPGRYQFVDVAGYDYTAMSKKPETQMAQHLKETDREVESKLSPEIQDLIKIIFNTHILKQTLESMRLDTSKVDLKSLSIPQLEAGFQVLTHIEELLKTRAAIRGDPLAESRFELKLRGLTAKYYAIVPHVFDIRSKPPPISSLRELRRKCGLLDDFIETVRSAKAVDIETSDEQFNAVDCYYDRLLFDLELLPDTAAIHSVIEQMIQLGHAPTHNSFSLTLKRIYSIKYRNSPPVSSCGNRKLLWHGSRLSNWAGILTSGLRIAPPEAPVSGYMFDKGVYFADLVSKSAQYCHASTEQGRAFLFLCEVALGNQYMRITADERAKRTIGDGSEYQSTLGIGATAPNPRQAKSTESIHGEQEKLHTISAVPRALKARDEKVIVPVGEQIDNKLMIQKAGGTNSELLYNEFVVYNTDQLVARYLVEVDFDFKSFKDVQLAQSSSSSSPSSSSSASEDESGDED